MKRKLVKIVKSRTKSPEQINFVIEEVKRAGGIQYTLERMVEYRNEAIQLLHTFPESEVRLGLEELVRYTTDRSF